MRFIFKTQSSMTKSILDLNANATNCYFMLVSFMSSNNSNIVIRLVHKAIQTSPNYNDYALCIRMVDDVELYSIQNFQQDDSLKRPHSLEDGQDSNRCQSFSSSSGHFLIRRMLCLAHWFRHTRLDHMSAQEKLLCWSVHSNSEAPDPPIAATCQASLLAAKRNTLVSLVGCESDRTGGSDGSLASGGSDASGGSIWSGSCGKFGWVCMM